MFGQKSATIKQLKRQNELLAQQIQGTDNKLNRAGQELTNQAEDDQVLYVSSRKTPKAIQHRINDQQPTHFIVHDAWLATDKENLSNLFNTITSVDTPRKEHLTMRKQLVGATLTALVVALPLTACTSQNTAQTAEEAASTASTALPSTSSPGSDTPTSEQDNPKKEAQTSQNKADNVDKHSESHKQENNKTAQNHAQHSHPLANTLHKRKLWKPKQPDSTKHHQQRRPQITAAQPTNPKTSNPPKLPPCNATCTSNLKT